MFNKNEAAEKAHLAFVLAELRRAWEETDERVKKAYQSVMTAKQYVVEQSSEMDGMEFAANQYDISFAIDLGERVVIKRNRLAKMIASPYFGRVDFRDAGATEADVWYIGLYGFEGPDGNELICDWRSPVAGLFYDYDIGKAVYSAPAGDVEGEVVRKRQFKIHNGAMEYMIESGVAIRDEVLQKELSVKSNDKMKSIVSTIQKEQNAIIRNESAPVLIIQGVAGSGKTSVALHRVAYLLYKYRGTLESKHIRILSPNRVFADYIANVLPELGEEHIPETSMEELAAAELGDKFQFQTFHEQVAELTAYEDPSLIERIRYKSTATFVEELDSFLRQGDDEWFFPRTITIGRDAVPEAAVAEGYEKVSRLLPVKRRLEKLASFLISNTRDVNGNKWNSSAAAKIKTAVRSMYKYKDALSMYKAFYQQKGRQNLFELKPNRTLEYSDVFPLIYIKMHLEGVKTQEDVKHVLVDEMQDYTPVQFAVLSRWFPCKKTILGDGFQTVNPYASCTLEDFRRIFPKAHIVELTKSYRSTFEILQFAQTIVPNARIEPLERHGDTPSVVECRDERDQLEMIRRVVAEWLGSGDQTLGIVCKTADMAERVYRNLEDLSEHVCLLDFQSETFPAGIAVTTAHLAKGLEFDGVIVPFANAYQSELDRHLLYVACTRAMHRLVVTYVGSPSPFLLGSSEPV
ncbi:HelD family protein [Thermoflavimicrobium daqui]|jgi:DNA helicase-2/ATP-dependent DNA helicase PcrA|uniref:Helicase n=1 Tax=Thermoflavimicrobium daqui TaxID=2137476 RepID=A0A364K409_9BACL|nr:ATP-binding domain-containing protein [Thermoflavimicrobium daqui]RAL24103.1 helicase [Thermoflavimicrobium daqui]